MTAVVGAETVLTVNEVFGPTLQGEGPSCGRAAGFVRLGRCNLACTFCDSRHSWDWDQYDPALELHEMGVTEIVARLDAMAVSLVVITGGEPLLQQRHLAPLAASMKTKGWRVEVETAGTVSPKLPEDLVDQWNVSPKLANSGMPVERRLKPAVLAELMATGRAVFKFVVETAADLEEIDALVSRFGLAPVWVMPEGTDSPTVLTRLRELAEPVLARGWNLTPRLHILLWGDERAR